MKITEQDFREQYETLGTEELIELYTKTELTDLASSVLTHILEKRGVPLGKLPKFSEKKAKAAVRKRGMPYKIMKHLNNFLVFFLIWFILIVINNGAGFLVEQRSLQESLEDPWTYFGSLIGALFFTILYRKK
jgi:hypothetical protein